MAKITMAYAGLLILIGVGGYFLTGMASVTALIPAFMGIPVLLCGILAELKPGLRAHAMHGAVLVGLLAFLGTARSFASIPALLGGTAERPEAVVAQAITAVLSLAFVALCVQSFISARRRRQASEAGATNS